MNQMSPSEIRGEFLKHGIQITTRTIRRWCEYGYIPGAKKIGRNWHIPSDRVNQIVRDGLVINRTHR